MQRVRFHLAISSEDYLAYYQGVARTVLVHAHDRRRVEFPAEHLRPFVTRDGIHGEFEMEFDRNNKFVTLRKID